MDKMIITFGQSHAHAINNRTFDRNCVAVIECEDYNDGRTIAHSMFGTQFCMAYMEDEFPVESMKYYHRGMLLAN